jgi:hypothetical protein
MFPKLILLYNKEFIFREKRMVIRLIFLPLFVFILFPRGFSENYLETFYGTNRVQSVSYFETNGSRVFFIYSNSVEMHRDMIDASNGETLSWNYINFSSSTKTAAEKNGDALFVNVYKNGKSYRNIYTNIQEIWDQTSIICWMNQLKSGKAGPFHFIAIAPDTGELEHLEFNVDKIEDIEWKGSAVETYRTVETVRGIPALLYSSMYWFRKSDGFFIRFEGLRSSSGSPWIIETME